MMPGQTQITIPSNACQQEVRRGRGLEHFVPHGVLVPVHIRESSGHPVAMAYARRAFS